MPRDDHAREKSNSIRSKVENGLIKSLEDSVDPNNPPPLPDEDKRNRTRESDQRGRVSKEEIIRFLRVISRAVQRELGTPIDEVKSLDFQEHDKIIRLLPHALNRRFAYSINGKSLDSLKLVEIVCKEIGEKAAVELRRIARSTDRKVSLDARSVLEKMGMPFTERSWALENGRDAEPEEIRGKSIEYYLGVSRDPTRKRKEQEAALRELSSKFNLKPADWLKQRFESCNWLDRSSGIKMLKSYPKLIPIWISTVIQIAASSSEHPEVKKEASKCLLRVAKKWLQGVRSIGEPEIRDIHTLLSLPLIQNEIADELLNWLSHVSGPTTEAALSIFAECRSLGTIDRVRIEISRIIKSDKGTSASVYEHALELLARQKRTLLNSSSGR